MIIIKLGEKTLATNVEDEIFYKLAIKWEKNKTLWFKYENIVYLSFNYGKNFIGGAI